MNAETMSNAGGMATRWFSLRRRLMLLLLGGVTVGWLTMLVLAYVDAHHEIDEIFDAQLVQTAQTLLALASEYDGDDEAIRMEGDTHKYQKKIIFQLWDAKEHLLLHSKNAPTVALTEAEGFSEIHKNGHWRFYVQWDREHQLRAVVGEDHHVRAGLIAHIVMRLMIPGIFGLPLLGVWIWFATRRGLASIDEVATRVGGLAPEHLEPLAPVAAPSEIRPLLEALNALFVRVGQTLDNERRFTADAAHELRTPLAAIATQAQVAERARDPVERKHAIEQVVAGARHAGHLVEQLLTLARLDPAAVPPMGQVHLGEVAAEACAAHGTIAMEKDIALELDAPADVVVSGNADMLRILLRNLVDNALRYTPSGGTVGVGVMAAGDGVQLTVSDSGPGIPAEERKNALRRFHRLAGQHAAGSGLGLSIVARIAELHGAQLALEDGANGTGLTVRLKFV